MSMPMYQQQQQQQEPPPAVTVVQQSNAGESQHGSVGPVVGVLIVIIVLGVVAVMIGRLCSGRRIMGHGQYDIESWAERKCSTCIDGRINLSLPRATESTASVTTTPSQETKQAGQTSQNSTPNL